MKRLILPILTLFLLVITAMPAYSYPPLPTEFYGEIMFYNSQSPVSQTLNAYDNNGTLCGTFTTKLEGLFGILSCTGDDNQTPTDEGPLRSEAVSFTFAGQQSSVIGDGAYSPGEYHNITIIVPKIICGDNHCQDGYEFCGSIDAPPMCYSDCDICTPVNQTPPPPSGSKPPSGGGGGGGSFNPEDFDLNKITGDISINVTPCNEQWNCTDWGQCFMNETQVRVCTDVNECNTTKNKPPELQVCIYEGNCYDHIRNGLETGIDCGGPCRPCPGKEDEPHCFDGIKNCHSGACEEGIDCGGPCENKCQKKAKVEAPIKICNRPSELFRLDFILLYLLIIISTAIYVLLEKEHEKRIKKNKKLKDVERARKYLAVRRNIILFLIFIVLLFSSLMFYYIFLYCSNNFWNFLKFLFLALAIIPFLAYFILRFFEYDEKEKKRLLQEFLGTHHEHLKKLVMLHNDYLRELEVEVSNEIYQVSKKEGFTKYLDEYPRIKTVYRDMLILYDKYKEQNNPFGIEKELCEQIKSLEDNTHFQKLANEHTEIKSIYEKLATLYKAYEEKQELYDELEEPQDIISVGEQKKDKAASGDNSNENADNKKQETKEVNNLDNQKNEPKKIK